MKSMCEANCGNRTEVYGNKYCPDCHDKYAPAYFGLQFCPSSEIPKYSDKDADFILLNRCDGYHLAEAHFFDDGSFDEFYSFGMEQEYTKEFYVAWAKLPDTVKKLHPIFCMSTTDQ